MRRGNVRILYSSRFNPTLVQVTSLRNYQTWRLLLHLKKTSGLLKSIPATYLEHKIASQISILRYLTQVNCICFGCLRVQDHVL